MSLNVSILSVSPSLWAFALSTFSSFALGFPVYAILLRYKVVNIPNARSSHTQPTVRGGGVAILLAFIAVTLVLPHRSDGQIVFTLLLAAALLGIVSFVDDLRSLPAGLRFGCHALAALMALVVLRHQFVHLSPFGSAWRGLLEGIGWLILFLWITGYTNAFNFMDGINGIASIQCVLTATGSAIVAGLVSHDWGAPPVLLAFALAGAAAGFLPHNFPTARMFMGDVSSAPLGFLLSTIVLWLAAAYGGWLIVPLALLHANFVLDTAITVTRRILRRERWRESHREHFYQRLVRAGKTHLFVTTCETILQLIVVLLVVGYVISSSTVFRFFVVCAVMLIWTLFFGYCELRFRKRGAE